MSSLESMPNIFFSPSLVLFLSNLILSLFFFFFFLQTSKHSTLKMRKEEEFRSGLGKKRKREDTGNRCEEG